MARIYRAPGRINLIGEHTDYNDGWVLPAAIALEARVAVTPRADRALHITSRQFAAAGNWSNTLQGIAALLQRGADVEIDSDVPIGAGLSSSAAVEVALALGLNAEYELGLDPDVLAKLCQRASHEFGHTRCGIMDLYVAAHARQDQFCLLDTRSIEARWIARPTGMALVACDSGVRHEHATGAYNQRRAECEAAARALGVPALRDATLEMLAAARLEPMLHRRARHVITENARVHDAVAALESGDFGALGELLNQSHASLRDDFEVSCPELDALADRCRAFPGVFGARMVGGGFGGCVLALVAPDRAGALAAAMPPSWQV